jgi:hypothetical protein
MVSDVDRLGKSYKVKVWLQEFGGKVAGEFKGRGKARGYMRYMDVTKSRQDIVKKILDKISSL